MTLSTPLLSRLPTASPGLEEGQATDAELSLLTRGLSDGTEERPSVASSSLVQLVAQRKLADSPFQSPVGSPPSLRSSPLIGRSSRLLSPHEVIEKQIAEGGHTLTADEIIPEIWNRPGVYRQLAPEALIKREGRVVKAALQSDPALFFALPEDIQADRGTKKIAFLLAKQRGRDDVCQQLIDLDGSLEEFGRLLSQIQWREKSLQHFFEENPAAKNDKEFFTALVCSSANDGFFIPWMGEALRLDRDFLLFCSEMERSVLSYASEELKRNPEFVFAMIACCPRDFEAADISLQRDRQFILHMMEQDGLSLAYIAREWKQDEGIAQAAVTQNGMALAYVDETAKTKGVVLSALSQNVGAFVFVPKRFRRDPEVRRIIEEHADPFQAAVRGVAVRSFQGFELPRGGSSRPLSPWMS